MTPHATQHEHGELELSCPAKVNLVLSVGQPVDGPLHPLVSWMVLVDFADTLSLTLSHDDTSHYDIRPAESVGPGGVTEAGPAHGPRVCVDWPLEADLAYRAHRLVQDHVGKTLAVCLKLAKRIPAGGGLGGGSSNAAATLIGLNELFRLGLGPKTLLTLGQRLGSDVGFLVDAMLGVGSGLVTGVGDRIEPMPLAQTIDLVLIFPPFACPTGSVYGAFDRLPHTSPPVIIDPLRVRQLAGDLPLDPQAPFNDLAEAAFAVVPQLREISQALQQQLAHPVHVTGSGSTLFLVAPDASSAAKLAKQTHDLAGLPAVATKTRSGQPWCVAKTAP